MLMLMMGLSGGGLQIGGYALASRVVLEWYNGGSWNGWLDLGILAMASLDSMDLELMSAIPNNVSPFSIHTMVYVLNPSCSPISSCI
jgi:hypothetical protein